MTDQLPPHNPETEQAVLGAALQDRAALDECRIKIRTPLAFYEPQNQTIWETLCGMADSSEQIDSITVYQRLSQDRRLSDAGGLEYLHNLPDKCSHPSMVGQYLDDLCDCFLRRQFIAKCAERSREAQRGGSPAETMIEQFQAELDHLHEEQTELVDGKTAAKLLQEDLQRRFELGGQLSGVPTGFTDFDAKTDGVQYGDQTIIASRPSIGKSAIAMNIFYHAAVIRRIPSLFVSLEMSIEALMRRMASYNTEITMGQLRRGSYVSADFAKLKQFTLRSTGAPIWFINGVQGMTAAHLCAEVRRACRKHGVRFVVIDYLQRIFPDKKHEKRTYEVGAVSTQLCGLADQTGAALLTLAQLNRESEKDKKMRPPRLSDLGDSKQIEQDADTVGLLHRDRSNASGEAWLFIAKQRDGETGAIKLTFNGPLCRFENSQPYQQGE